MTIQEAKNKGLLQVGVRVETDGDSLGTYWDGAFKGTIQYVGNKIVTIKREDSITGGGKNGGWRIRVANEEAFIKILTKETHMNKLSATLKRLLDAGTKKLVKADFLDNELALTREGRRALWAILLEENKDSLVAVAEELIEEAKEERDCK